jgi:hypothetical protein
MRCNSPFSWELNHESAAEMTAPEDLKHSEPDPFGVAEEGA